MAPALDPDYQGFTVWRVAPTWFMRTAYKKGRAAWAWQVRETMKQFARGSVLGQSMKPPPYHDFRVRFAVPDQTNVPTEFLQYQYFEANQAGLYADTLPMSASVHGDAAPADTPEYAYSTVIAQDSTNEYELALFGDSDVSTDYTYGMLYEYDRATQVRNRPEKDADSDETPYYEIAQNAGQSTLIMDNLLGKGDVAPWDQSRFEPLMEYVGTISAGFWPASDSIATPWTWFPLGMVICMPLKTDVGNTHTPQVHWEVKRGRYKGVAAAPAFCGY